MTKNTFKDNGQTMSLVLTNPMLSDISLETSSKFTNSRLNCTKYYDELVTELTIESKLEKEIKNYITKHPNCVTSEILNEFKNYDIHEIAGILNSICINPSFDVRNK